MYSYFVLDGDASINEEKVEKGDFFIVSDSKDLVIIASSITKIFEIKSPKRPSYNTYSERFSR